MKILILGLPRSGTSSLYDFLRKSLPMNYQCKYEPFKTEYIGNFNSNCLIKSVLTNEILLKESQTLLQHTIELVSNFDFNKVIDGNVVYEYEKIYTNDISESLIDICKKVNIVINEKIFNSYIHPKNKNNIKILNSII